MGILRLPFRRGPQIPTLVPSANADPPTRKRLARHSRRHAQPDDHRAKQRWIGVLPADASMRRGPEATRGRGRGLVDTPS
jgi:hypothetical protein